MYKTKVFSKGTIQLKYGNELVATKLYESQPHRRHIVHGWSKLYGPLYNKMALHILPEEIVQSVLKVTTSIT